MKFTISLLVLINLIHGSRSKDSKNSIVFVDYINSLNTTWKAGVNFADLSSPYIRKLSGTLYEPGILIKSNQIDVNQSITFDLPDHFDSRDAWPECDSIGTIRDQGACGSCWAVSTVSSMSDRLCIKSNGTINVQLSDDEVLSCCGSVCGFGCNGGRAIEAFNYWIKHGIVTGGPYHGDGCLPYSVPPCEHHMNGSRPLCDDLKPIETPYCMEKCVIGYERDFTADKFYGEKVYTLKSPSETMLDILTNGPVAAQMRIYTDFYHYKSGVYQHTIGESEGYHTVKLIGWGSDQGVDYWLAANSWNTDWGDKGLFKIKRGVNECKIEKVVIAGLPKLTQISNQLSHTR